jgi:hypothetical protein
MRRLLVLPFVALLVVAACGSNPASPSPAVSPSASASVAPTASAPASVAPTASASPTAAPSSSGDPAAEPTPPTDDTGEIPSDAVTPQPTAAASGSPTPEPRAACQRINGAIDIVDLYLQYFTQADETTWADMTGPESPIEFDRAKFTKATALLRQDPAMKNAAPLLRSLDRTLGQALASDAPFASNTAPGSILVRAANRNFVQIEEALVAVRTAQGCG